MADFDEDELKEHLRDFESDHPYDMMLVAAALARIVSLEMAVDSMDFDLREDRD